VTSGHMGIRGMQKMLNHHGVNPAIAHLSSKAKRRILESELRIRESGEWGAWERLDPKPMLSGQAGWLRDVNTAWRNKVFCVLVRDDEVGVIHAAVSSLSGVRPSWYEMQRIKDELFGATLTAVEIYPPHSEIVDGSDMFHLWVLPKDIPFGLTKLSASRQSTTSAGNILLGTKGPLS